jgi:hypothetical protein
MKNKEEYERNLKVEERKKIEQQNQFLLGYYQSRSNRIVENGYRMDIGV